MFNCDQCSYSSQSLKYLKRHSRVTHGEPQACPECNASVKHLKQHMDLVHMKKTKKHKESYEYCDKCDYKTKWKVNLRLHVQNILSELRFLKF